MSEGFNKLAPRALRRERLMEAVQPMVRCKLCGADRPRHEPCEFCGELTDVPRFGSDRLEWLE